MHTQVELFLKVRTIIFIFNQKRNLVILAYKALKQTINYYFSSKASITKSTASFALDSASRTLSAPTLLLTPSR